METIKYRGFTLKKSVTNNEYIVTGRSFFEPVNIQYTYGTIEDCKKYINHFLKTFQIKSL